MIYFIQAGENGNIKIGFTAHDDAAVRMAQLQTGCPAPLRLLATISGGMEDEKALQMRFAHVQTCGEWFQPIPELLTLIPSVTPLVCGKVEVVPQSVQIRVLTVGRKQFGKALFDQLPYDHAMDWHVWNAFFEHFTTRPQDDRAASSFNIDGYQIGEPWGWVKLSGQPGRYVVFAENGQLKKYHYGSRPLGSEREYLMAFCRPRPGSNDNNWTTACDSLYRRFVALPGWRSNDQLFIGV